MARVLIVEDDPASMDLALRIVRLEKHEPITTSDGETALAVARVARPDLILLDLHMPHLDGFTVLSQLQPELPAGFPILLITGEVDETTRQKAIDRGARDVLTKPYEMGKVLDAVERLLRDRLPQT